ncbi:MAG: TonB-dependent receptor [Burkholderiales bacterium]
MKLRRTSICIAVGTAACGGSLAQDMRVNVTGSNIKRVDTETAAPIETITRADIQASGLQTISDVVRQITANNNGTVSPSFTNGFSASGSAVSLRGLGPNNTLVLLNGRRLANFGLAEDAHASYVDLQQIPFDAVERIEVLKDGASAIYGTDAVAGVVNVILRQQYTGLTATATAGTTYNGEGNQYKGAITFGTGDLTRDRYNLFVTLDGQRQDAYPSNRARDYVGSNDLRFMGLPDSRPGSPTSISASSLLGNVRPVAAGNPNGPAGPYRSLPGECAAVNQDGAFCRWERKDYTDLSPAIDRFNVFARGTYRLAESVEAYADLSYFDVRTDTRGPPTSTRAIWYDPSRQSIQSSLNIYLPVGHPDNPFSANGQFARLYYTDGALGGSSASYDTGTQRYLLGVKGTTSGWDWDVAGLYIRSDTDVTRRNTYSYSRLLQGLAGAGPYGYYRIGAAASLNDPAVYDWIAPDRSYTAVAQDTVVDAKASRDVYALAGGNLALAVGYEFRREELSNPGLPGQDTGDVVGLGYAVAFGARNVNAIYAELYAPLLKNLEVTAALRYDDYSDAGGTTNPKVGIKWTALPSLVLRGTWQTAFRAPGLYETGSTGAAFGLATDPVRCPVTGLPADCNATGLGLLVGNPDLKPETSTTYTLGVIWEPAAGLSTALDYWNIRVDGRIASTDNPVLVRDTNNLPGIPNSGTILYALVPWVNASNIKTDGIDLDVVWRQSLREWGNLTTELQWTHVFRYSQTFPDGTTYRYDGTQGDVGVGSSGGTPSDRINLILGWSRGPWNVTGTLRYISDYQSVAYRGAQDDPDVGCLSTLDGPTCHVPSFTTLDLAAQYTGFKNWQVFGSIVNVFNRIAPFNPAAVGNSVNYNYNYAFTGATGMQFNLGARYTFE